MNLVGSNPYLWYPVLNDCVILVMVVPSPLPLCLRTCKVQSGDPSLAAQAPCLLGRMEIVYVQGHAPWSGVEWGRVRLGVRHCL